MTLAFLPLGAARTKADETNAERTSFRDDIPGLARRGAAKAIDFIAVVFTVVGFSSVTHSYLAGLLIGYAWLALSDWFGSLGKSVMKLEVRDRGTGGACSARASILRNVPIIATALQCLCASARRVEFEPPEACSPHRPSARTTAAQSAPWQSTPGAVRTPLPYVRKRFRAR